jgi:hypothetical protein
MTPAITVLPIHDSMLVCIYTVVSHVLGILSDTAVPSLWTVKILPSAIRSLWGWAGIAYHFHHLLLLL